LKALYRRGVAYSKNQDFDKAQVNYHLFSMISNNYWNWILKMYKPKKN